MAGAAGDSGMAPAGVPGAPCRINGLPNDVLLRAISYLNARQVVQTCVLSRRWRDLWRDVPRINASCEEFDGMAETDEECIRLFKKFINRFLMLRNPNALDEFRLWYTVRWGTFDHAADSADANLWIGQALQCNARSIEVSGIAARLRLDPELFIPKCLLTSLELSRVVLFPSFFQNLQAGCTNLLRLILSDCGIEDIEISSQTVKVLTIDVHSDFWPYEQPSISVPNLIDLGYFAHGRIPLLKNTQSLVTASVSVGDDDTEIDDICQFLRSLSGVTNLNFNYKGKMLKMQENLQWCPKFSNLTILTLGAWSLHANYYAMTVFVQNSPNLLKLTLDLRELGYDTFSRFLGEIKESSVVPEHLETVAAVCSMDRVNLMEKILLEHGVTSDQIDIKHLEGDNAAVLTLRVQDRK